MDKPVLYGIKNCDTVKKTQKWLAEHRIDFAFHDFRDDGLDQAMLAQMETSAGWETLLNKRSTSWREVDDARKQSIDRASALQLMQETPTLIKRPVLQLGDTFHVGFSAQLYSDLFL